MPRKPQDTDTMSTASTLVPQSTRTTLTGNPITYTHDSLSNTDPGFGGSSVGANTLPPGYTDSSLVHIPIRTHEYLPRESETTTLATPPPPPPSEIKREKTSGGGVWGRMSKALSGGHPSHAKKDDGGLKIISMSRGDYLKYWAKGEDGNFRAGVVEPEEGRAVWLARALERQEREGGVGRVDAARRRTRGTEGAAGAFGAAGALIGGGC